jgi:hypothetical protein
VLASFQSVFWQIGLTLTVGESDVNKLEKFLVIVLISCAVSISIALCREIRDVKQRLQTVERINEVQSGLILENRVDTK